MRNRLELLAVEWQEERVRLTHILGWSIALILACVLTVLFLTATVIFLCPAELRIYMTASFTVLYGVVAFLAWLGLRSVLKRQPFTESIDQVQKDREWLESLK